MNARRSAPCARPAIVAVLLLLGAAAAAADDPPRVPVWPAGTPVAPCGPAGLTVVERAAPGAPRDRYAQDIVHPDLTLFPAARPGGCALLIIPGGAYQRVVMDKEGYESAQWFAARGIAAFVLRYRLPGEYAVPRPDLPLHDAARALRVVRARAPGDGFDPGCVGVLGFSAGGHLAGLLATAGAPDDYAPVDDIDRLPARPDFAVLMYPVVTMRAPLAHMGSRDHLLGAQPSAGDLARWSLDERVKPEVPPTFLLHAADDTAVDAENSFVLYRALVKAGVPVELHVYAEGGHGFGLRGATDLPVGAWPELVQRWILHRAARD